MPKATKRAPNGLTCLCCQQSKVKCDGKVSPTAEALFYEDICKLSCEWAGPPTADGRSCKTTRICLHSDHAGVVLDVVLIVLMELLQSESA